MQAYRSRFEEIYGGGGEIRSFFAPGRINLIGEHIDYNGGRVLPCALGRGTYLIARLRRDRIIQLASENRSAGRVYGFSLDEPPASAGTAGRWIRYPGAVIRAFRDAGHELVTGFDALFIGDLSIGAGLSTSSSIEVVTALMLREFYGCEDVDGVQLALLSQRAEQDYLGNPAGIMNPFASAMGRKDHAIFLSSQKLKYEYIPLHLGSVRIVLTNTMVRHAGFHDTYILRREECGKALKKLKVVSNISCLCDLSADTFNSCKDVIMNDVYTKRARHAVTENARTIRGVSALRVGNLRRLGELMNLSHRSLRDDYEISCPELDFLVELAQGTPGVLGSRMTGSGFGGCTVSLIEEAAIPEYERKVTAAYEERFGVRPDVCVVFADDGAREIESM